jgi:hypothetical protein
VGLAINSTATTFDQAGHTDDDPTAAAVGVLARQVVEFAERWSAPQAPR